MVNRHRTRINYKLRIKELGWRNDLMSKEILRVEHDILNRDTGIQPKKIPIKKK